MTDQEKDAIFRNFCRLPRADQIALQRFLRRVADARRAGEPVSFVEAAREIGNARLIAVAEAVAN